MIFLSITLMRISSIVKDTIKPGLVVYPTTPIAQEVEDHSWRLAQATAQDPI
jgi:hypothetical protein